MADVLLVFVREDEAHAAGIAESLERSGLTVARGGNVFDVTEEAACVLVAWSPASTRSAIVRDVAIRAQREGKLVAVKLGECETPLGFSRPAPHDLAGWRGDPDDPLLDPMFFAADRLVCAARLGAQSAPEAPAPPPRRTASTPPLGARPSRVEPDSAPADIPSTPPIRTAGGYYAPVGGRRSAAAPQIAPQAPPVDAAASGPAPAEHAAPRLPPNVTEEALAWKRIENSSDAKDFLDYLSQYSPNGIFCELAQMRIDKLMGGKGRPPAGAFIAHTPSPHGVRERPRAAPKPPQQRRADPPAPPEPEPEPIPEIRPAELRPLDTRPPLRAADPPVARPAPAPQWLDAEETDFVRRPPARTATGRPRRRVEADVRRAPERAEGGLPWRPLLIIALIGAGGLAFMQALPKQAQTAAVEEAQPPSYADAPRAGPMDAAGSEEAAPPAEVLEPAAPPRAVMALNTPPARPQPAPRAAQPRPQPQPAQARVQRLEDRAAVPPPPSITFVAPPISAAQANAAQSAQPAAAPTPAPSAAAPAAAASSAYVTAVWLSRPNGARMQALYPTRALSLGRGGEALLNCFIQTSGKLDCVVERESPANYGFGAAALRASAFFVADPAAADGAPAYGKRTRLHIKFAQN
ncbi:MAG: hypothetical protein AB7M12_09540 [Hyphomonadaceae bacterium]